MIYGCSSCGESPLMLRPTFAIFAQNYLSAILGDFGTVFLNEPIPRDPNLRIFKIPSRSNWESDYLKAITFGTSQVMVSPEVIGEAQLVDVLFEPDRNKSRESLGLLGQLTFLPCIIEVQRWAPNEWELQTCLRHWLAWHSEGLSSIFSVNKTAINKNKKESVDSEKDGKTLLIIVPSINPQNLSGFDANPSAIKIPGVYSLPPAFCTTIVVTSELPVDISTVWLRLLGRGNTQRLAIKELAALDINHPHCVAVRQELRQWYRVLLQGDMGKESKKLMQTLAFVDELDEE